MTYKFEKLEIYRLALDYLGLLYDLAYKLPASEAYNLRPQIIRAGTSIVLNIAEGSTTQTDAEQSRFLSLALRSLIETVACQQIIERRNYAKPEDLKEIYEFSQKVFAKIQAMKNAPNRGKASKDRWMFVCGLLSAVNGQMKIVLLRSAAGGQRSDE